MPNNGTDVQNNEKDKLNLSNKNIPKFSFIAKTDV